MSAALISVLILFYCHRFVQADATLEMEQRDFARAALEYVCLIQVKPGMLFCYFNFGVGFSLLERYEKIQLFGLGVIAFVDQFPLTILKN